MLTFKRFISKCKMTQIKIKNEGSKIKMFECQEDEHKNAIENKNVEMNFSFLSSLLILWTIMRTFTVHTFFNIHHLHYLHNDRFTSNTISSSFNEKFNYSDKIFSISSANRRSPRRPPVEVEIEMEVMMKINQEWSWWYVLELNNVASARRQARREIHFCHRLSIFKHRRLVVEHDKPLSLMKRHRVSLRLFHSFIRTLCVQLRESNKK